MRFGLCAETRDASNPRPELKLEIAWTRHRKDWKASPSFMLTWLYPTLLLKPNEIYTRKGYLRSAILLTIALALVVPRLWSVMLDPKNHARQIGILSQEGFYYLPCVPLIWLVASFAVTWPTYFFWNRRAKRLQREGLVEVPVVAAALI